MRTCVFGEVPNPNAARPVTANDLALVRVYDYVVRRRAMVIASLDSACTSLPDLHSSIFRAGDHPLAFAVEGYPRNIARVSFKYEDRGRIRGSYIE